MKKKIVNAFLMMALVAPSVGSLTSCKDYNEDLSAELNGKLSKEITAREALQTQVNNLEKLVNTIKSCQCDMTKYLLTSDLAGYLAKYAKTADLADYAKKTDLPDLSGYAKSSDLDEYAKLSALAGLVSQTDVAGYVKVEGLDGYVKVGDLANYIKSGALDEYLKSADADAIYAKIDSITAHRAAIDLLNDAIKNLESKIDGYTPDSQIGQKISELNQAILDADAKAQQALDLAKNSCKLNCDSIFGVLNDSLASMKSQIVIWNTKLIEINEKAEQALAKAEKDSIWISQQFENYNIIINELKEQSSDSSVVNNIENYFQENIVNNYYSKEEITNLISELNVSVFEADSIAKEAMKIITSDTVRISTLETLILEKVSTTEFTEAVNRVDVRIDGLSEKVDNIDAKVVTIREDLSKMVTGIIAQSTSNPVLGYFNTPFGVNQWLLATYYGESDKGIEFPARDSKYYFDAANINLWTPRNLQVMGISNLKDVPGYFTKGDERFVTEVNGSVEGNAGTVYVTVNPNTVNFAGQKLAIETTAQKAAPIELSPLQISKDELLFGYYRNGTRAVSNGFYSANATLRVEDIEKAKVSVDLELMEEAVRNVIKKDTKDARTRISVAESAAMVMQSIENTIPAYGLKASWTDSQNKTHSLYSQYNLGVVAVKPLSFKFLSDLDVKSVDGFGRARSILASIIKQITIKRPDFASYEIDFESIIIGDDVTADADGNIKVRVVGVTETGETVDAVCDITATIVELVDAINDRYGEGSQVDKNLAKFFNEVRKTNNFETYIKDAQDNMYDAINTYLTRLENHILRVVNNINHVFFISMLGKQGNEMALISTSLDLPTKAKGEVTLIPTSYTMELMAPAFKKFVAVTNVYDAATKKELDLAEAKTLAAAANAGKNMFKVIDSQNTCTLKGEAGKIYEITYTAVDYHGVVMIKKLYVQF